MAESAPNVKAVFDRAIEIESPTERAAYVAEACAGDAALRQKVDVLLQAYSDAGSFLESAAEVKVEEPKPTADYQTDGERAGVAIAGRYTLVEPIGEGGMGSVWRAKQTEPVKRNVAVKLIKTGMDSKQVLARFEAERQALALMDHPNIAKVLDGGLHERRPFFVMELVKGVPITEYCDAKKLTPQERLELFVPVCQAIQHAHQKGIIHRDIKPSNVLVALYDDKPVVKVIDFGVAKATGAALAETTIDTGFGGVVGTPQYMSPEQATFNNLDIDTRSDVYALGVLLYELLTGSPPFSKQELEKRGLLEMLRVVREEEPPRPSNRLSTADALPTLSANRGTEPKKLTGLLRNDLDWIVMKALEKDRARRYETANGFAADVLRYLSGEAVQAHPPSVGYRLRKFAGRCRGQVIASGLVLLALVFGVIGTTWQAVKAERARAEEAKQRGIAEAKGREAADERAKAVVAAEQEKQAKEVAVRNLGFAERGNEILGSVFAGLDPKARYGTVAELRNAVKANLQKAVRELDGSAVGDPLAVARMQHTLGVSLFGLGEAKLAVEVLEKARATRTAGLGPDHFQTLFSTNCLVQAYLDAGRLDKAVPLCEETLTRIKAKFGPDHPQTLASTNNLALAYTEAGKWDKALPLYEETLTLAKARHGADDPRTLTTMENLAGGYRDAGQAAKAVPMLESVLAQRKDKLGPDHPDTLQTMGTLAGGYRDVGQLTKALRLYEEALTLIKAKLGYDHPETFLCINNLASCYWSLRRLDKSVPLLEQALALQEKKLGRDHPNTLTTVANLGVNYRDAGQLDKALPLLEESLVRRKDKLGPDHPDTLTVMNTLAETYQIAGRVDKALALFEEELTLAKSKFGPDHPKTLSLKNRLGTGFHFAGKLDKARPLFEEAFAQQKAKLGPDHPDTLMSMFNLGRLYADAGQMDKALPMIEETLTRRKALLAPDHPDILMSMGALAGCYRTAGRLDKALPLYEVALSINRAKLGPDHPDTLWSMHNLASCYWALRKLDKSVPLLEELLPLREKKLGRSHEDTLRTVGNLGVNYRDAGRLAEAIPLLEEAHRASKKYTSLHFVGPQLLDAYAKAGKPAEAAKLLGDVLADARRALPTDSLQLAGQLAHFGSLLLEMKGYAEAEPLLRQCLTVREKTQPDVWITFNTHSMLGGSLLGQNKYADAEPLLVKGYEGMKAREKTIPKEASTRIPEALDRLVELYTATNKPNEVKKWKVERAKYAPKGTNEK